MASIDRRTLAGAAVAAALAPAAALAQRANRAFTQGPLARNGLARHFEPVPETVAWPPSDLLSSGGRRPLSHYRGKAVLMALWSETCPPCLVEMPLFAELNARYANQRFEIVPVVTGSKRLNTLARAQKFLTDRNIALSTLIDGGKGADELLRTVAASAAEPRGALPCNLLIDAEGRLRGRQSGFVLEFPPGMSPRASPEELARAGVSIWDGPDTPAFFEALRGGALG